MTKDNKAKVLMFNNRGYSAEQIAEGLGLPIAEVREVCKAYELDEIERHLDQYNTAILIQDVTDATKALNPQDKKEAATLAAIERAKQLAIDGTTPRQRAKGVKSLSNILEKHRPIGPRT